MAGSTRARSMLLDQPELVESDSLSLDSKNEGHVSLNIPPYGPPSRTSSVITCIGVQTNVGDASVGASFGNGGGGIGFGVLPGENLDHLPEPAAASNVLARDESPVADAPGDVQVGTRRLPRTRQLFCESIATLVSLVHSDQQAQEPQVLYPPRFKALATLVFGFACSWVVNYFMSVLPSIEEHKDSPCKYNDSQLSYSAKMLFVYFMWCAFARISLFVPCVATRVASVQPHTHGFCRTYCTHLVIRDGPLYIFVVGSLLFWFHLMRSPNCEERSPELYLTLKLYAIYSIMVSVLCTILAYWHNKILVDLLSDPSFDSEDRSAPADTILKLATVAYDERLFGDEEGKLYPAECAICLGSWEENDAIKVTHCAHAFHEDCIGHWLRSARTCALCRQDLTKLPVAAASDASASADDGAGASPSPEPPRLTPMARVVGAPT